jgi:hypothetical protein
VYDNSVVITGRNTRHLQKAHDILMVAVRLPGDDVYARVLEAKAHKIGVQGMFADNRATARPCVG